VKIKKRHTTVIVPFVLYGYKNRPLTLTGEHWRRVFMKRVLRTIFGPTKETVTEVWKNCSMMSFAVCTLFKYY